MIGPIFDDYRVQSSSRRPNGDWYWAYEDIFVDLQS